VRLNQIRWLSLALNALIRLTPRKGTSRILNYRFISMEDVFLSCMQELVKPNGEERGIEYQKSAEMNIKKRIPQNIPLTNSLS